MSRPPIILKNPKSSLEQTNTEQINQSPNDKPKTETGENSPTVSNKPGPQTPFDRIFNPKAQTKRDDLDDESDKGNRPQQEKSSQGNEQKSSSKQADTALKGKAASSTRKVIIPSLKLGGSGTATLKSRAPVSPDSLSALGSHRAMSPRAGDVTPANSSSSASTPIANTQGQASSSAPPARSLPPTTQKTSSQSSPVSTSNVPLSARDATSTSSNAKGFPASKLTTRSKSILDSALVNGKIDSADLGYLLVEVQTAGFTLPTSLFVQGRPFLRAGLQVSGFTASDGQTYDSINIIEKFLEPMVEKVFATTECNNLLKNLERNYLQVASAMEIASRGMSPEQMHQSEKVKSIMDPVVQPLTKWVCGESETLNSSQFPDIWKSLLLGIDDAIVQWAKNIHSTDMKEIKRLRSEALVGFISTRGLMGDWGIKLQNFGIEKNIGVAKLMSYLNSYFAHKAGRFITDIMLSRKDLVADAFDTKMRGYINVLVGRKELVSKTPRENASGRRELMKSKTLHSTKAPKAEEIKKQEITQKESVLLRQAFFRGFSSKTHLAEISPDFFRFFQKRVVQEMSDVAYEKFKKNPVALCEKYLSKFYIGVLSKESQAAEKLLRAAIADIKKQDIDAIALATEKVKSYVKPDSEIAFSPRGKNLTEKNTEIQSLVQKNEISQIRREQFLGNFIFYTGIFELSKDFLKSFGNHILELSTADYVKFETTPIAFCLAYVDTFYSSHVTTTTRADRDRVAVKKGEFVYYLKHTTPEGLEGLRQSMGASPRLNLEFPANPFEEDEKQAINSPTTTASTQPPQDSRTPPVASVGLNPVAEDVKSEKTESSSESEIVTESDNDADDAASEKPEES